MFDSFSNSTRILIKGMTTGFLILIMLIPSIYILNLVEERQEYQREVIKEVSEKWSNGQTISGPYFVIPFTQTGLNDKKEMVSQEGNLLLLPEKLAMEGNLDPVEKRRGIYKVALYRAALNLSGNFLPSQVKAQEGQTIHWQNATLCLGIADSRGIEKQLSGKIGGRDISFEAGMPPNPLSEKGASVLFPLDIASLSGKIEFNIPVNIRGSEQLQVLPLGKTTTFKLQSPWKSPSFSGKFLPDYTLDAKGFAAQWEVLHFNRDFPQVWQNRNYNAKEYAFGLSLVQPVDNYDKTLRSVKYAILFVGLTFGFFFLFELLMGYKVHAVQYLLVGLALVIFFTLLLSISEFLGFNAAYSIAALATITLITLYAKTLFATWRNALMAGGFLALLYTYIFTLIQLEDSALLIGSIGLFLLVALAMYVSRRINWFGKSGTTGHIEE